MILYSLKDVKNLMHAQLSFEVQTNICLMKLKGNLFLNFRSLHDSICVAKRTLESGKIVAGGGAVDVALSIYLDQYCRGFSGK